MFKRNGDCYVEPYCYVVVVFIRFARPRDSNFKIRDSETRFIFYELGIETLRFRDSPKICRDPLIFKDHSAPLLLELVVDSFLILPFRPEIPSPGDLQLLMKSPKMKQRYLIIFSVSIGCVFFLYILLPKTDMY